MIVSETFHGFTKTTQDSLLIFEACRRDILPKISRRLQVKERNLVYSGSVFVFDKNESGIKRWTDGLAWSPSRIMGNFLIYREIEKKSHYHRKTTAVTKTAVSQRGNNSNSNPTNKATFDQNRSRERQLIGSLSDSYNFKKDGLIRKTTSIGILGATFHMISYYSTNDVLEHRLRTPLSMPELANLEISPELLSKQNFRIPTTIEPHRQSFQTLQPEQTYHHFIPLDVDLNNYNASILLTTSNHPTPHPSLPLNHFPRNASIATQLLKHKNHDDDLQSTKSSTLNILLSSDDQQQ